MLRLPIAIALGASLLTIGCDDQAPSDTSKFDAPVERPKDAVASGPDGAPIGSGDASGDSPAEGDVPVDETAADAPALDSTVSGQDRPQDGPAAPPECRVGPVPEAPYRVDFVFRNEAGTYRQDVFVETLCNRAMVRISSCASGYTDNLVPPCRCDCPRIPNCMGICQSCLAPNFELRNPGVQGGGRTWMAEEVMAEGAEPLMCPTARLLPAGIYRMTVQVRDVHLYAPIRTITKTFELPAPNNRVLIELNPRHDPGADAGTEAGGG